MDQQAEKFAAFLLLWHQSPLGEATCSQLLPLAEEAGVQLGRATTQHGKLGNLGLLMSEMEDKWITVEGCDVAIRKTGLLYGKTRYRLIAHRPPPEMKSGR